VTGVVSGPRRAVRGRRIRSWPLFVIAVPAGVAVWSGWVGLGQMTGFGLVHPLPGIRDNFTINSAITLPVGVEAYAAYAMRVWFAGSRIPAPARRFAAVSAVLSLVVGLAGQGAYHLMEASNVVRAPWGITLAVSCLPVLVFGMAVALAHLLHSADGDQESTELLTDRTVDQAPGLDQAPVTGIDPAGTAQPVPDQPDLTGLTGVVDPGQKPAETVLPGPPDPEESVQVVPETWHSKPATQTPVPVRRTNRSGNAEIVRLALVKQPDASIADLATLTGLSRNTVRKYRELTSTGPGTDAVSSDPPVRVNGHRTELERVLP
jgi:hypothetical protein